MANPLCPNPRNCSVYGSISPFDSEEQHLHLGEDREEEGLQQARPRRLRIALLLGLVLASLLSSVMYSYTGSAAAAPLEEAMRQVELKEQSESDSSLTATDTSSDNSPPEETPEPEETPAPAPSAVIPPFITLGPVETEYTTTSFSEPETPAPVAETPAPTAAPTQGERIETCLQRECNGNMGQLGQDWSNASSLALLKCLGKTHHSKADGEACFEGEKVKLSKAGKDLKVCAYCAACLLFDDLTDKDCAKDDSADTTTPQKKCLGGWWPWWCP